MTQVTSQAECVAVAKLPAPRRLGHTGIGPRSKGISGLFESAMTLACALIPLILGGWIVGKGLGLFEGMRLEAGWVARLFTVGLGLVFLIPGIFLVARAFSGLREVVRRTALIFRRKRAAPWEWDYPWPKTRVMRDIQGAGHSMGAAFVLYGLFFAVAALLTLLVAILVDSDLNWETLQLAGFLVLIVGAMLALFVVAIRDVAPDMLRWPRFGRTYVALARLPFRRGEVVEMTWFAPRVGECRRLTFELLYLREVREWTAGAKGSTVSYVPFEHWKGQQVIQSDGTLDRDDPVTVRFAVPPEAPGTDLSARLPAYWDLSVTADRPGTRFSARYLIPIY